MLLHHGSAPVLVRVPPGRILADRHHYDIGFRAWIRRCLQRLLQIVRKARNVIGFLGKAVEGVRIVQILAKSGAHEIDQEILVVEDFSRMHTDKEVRLFGKTTQQVRVRHHLVGMFLKHGLHICGSRTTSALVQFPPISINFEDRKRSIHPRILQELLAVGGSLRRMGQNCSQKPDT